MLVSNDNEANWEVLYPSIGNYDVDSLFAFTYHCLPGYPAYCGNSGGWVDAEFDLSSFAGDTIQLKFLFGSDKGVSDHEGWHIDDIEISGNREQIIWDDGLFANQTFEGFSERIQRGKTYYWKLKGIDRFSLEEDDFVESSVKSFQVKKYPSVSGFAYLENQSEHDSIKIVLAPLSPHAIRDSAYTDTDGYYNFNNVVPGTYKVEYSKNEYEDYSYPDNIYIYSKNILIDDLVLNNNFYIPENFHATLVGDSIAMIKWDSMNSSNLTGYNIYKKLSSEAEFELYSQFTVNDTTFIDSIDNNVGYEYIIRAEYYNSLESEDSNIVNVKGWYAGPNCYVATDGSGSYGSGTLASPLSSIQHAVYCIRSGDKIIVNPGTYYENIDFMGKNIELLSLYPTTQDTSYISQTVIDGQSSGSVITVNSGEDSTSVINGFTIQNGFAGGGGGLKIIDSHPVLKNLVVKNNYSTFAGGGIHNANGSMLIENVDFLNNMAEGVGGAIYKPYNIINCNFYLNTADLGGAIYTSTCNIEKCVFAKNKKTDGSSSAYGGTISIYGGAVNMDKITITETLFGHAVYLRRNSNATATINNSIIWNNHRGCDQDDYSGGTYNITYSNGFSDSTNINLDPMFLDPENNDYSLKWDSPCIDSGNPDPIYNDPDGTRANMGAEYFDPSTPYLLFTCNDRMGEPPFTVQFIDESYGTYDQWEWDFQNDGVVDSYEQNPQFTYDDMGSFDVSLKLTNSTGGADSVCYNNFISVLNNYGVWTSEHSPYYIYEDITISDGNTLTLEPGVVVRFMDANKINVQGRILAEGTYNDSIKFTAKNISNGWNGIRFINTPATNDSSKFSYCIFEKGNSSAIFINNISKITISNNIFRNNISNGDGVAIHLTYSDINIVKNAFLNNRTRWGIVDTDYSDCTISHNIFANNSSFNSSCALHINHANNIQLISNTFVNNKQSCYAGIVSVTHTNNLEVRNCVSWRNTSSRPNPNIIDTSNNVVNSEISYCNIEGGYAGIGNINSEPLFVDPTEGAGLEYNGEMADWSLQENSPCIDTGDPDPVYNDPDGTRADMGALFFNQSLNVPININIQQDNDMIHVSWDEVARANSYIVYSSSSPDGPFTKVSASSEEFTVDGSRVFWTGTMQDTKKFYYIKASTDEWDRDIIDINEQQH